MPDRLIIAGLAAECHIGVTDEEQSRRQAVQFDLELEIDASKAALRDDVHDAIDYAALVSVVKQGAEGKPYRLLETMAEDVAALVLRRFEVPQVLVRITKRALPGIESAAVEITRTR